MKTLFAVLALSLTVGCHAQLPASPAPAVSLSWTAPATCTTALPCTYAISRATTTTGSCPATTGTLYTLVGTSASQATTLVDTAPPPGTTSCYIAQTQQASLVSTPSNSVLIAIPALPTAPALNAPTVTAEVAMPEPTIAQNEPLHLTARVGN
jgi:hypothetical protein